jgi:hypothetical protein
VVAALDRTYLDELFDAQLKYCPGQLGDNATKDFVLRHVFEIAPELIKESKDLLRVLLRRHYIGQRIPSILDERFIQVLRQNSMFEDWPLEDIIPKAKAFFEFLQERWPVFLDSFTKSKEDVLHEDVTKYNFKFSGPALLPFDHHDVRIYIDNLFLEGLLHPVPHKHAETLTKTWVTYGIKVSPEESRRRRLEGLLDSIEKTVPLVEARYGEWLFFAYRWAHLKVLSFDDWVMNKEGMNLRDRIDQLTYQVDSRFIDWVVRHYASLINLPATEPVMLHHLPRYFSYSLHDHNSSLLKQIGKLAFLMVDGLALDQWIVLREVLEEQDSTLRFHEKTLFAWIPTITSVSRQAAFAGRPPIYFPESIHTTDKEARLWKQFWVDQGFNANEVAYVKRLGDGNLSDVSELLSRPKLRVVGLVIDKVDQIMHGMKLGTAGMHNQVRQWAKQGFMRDLLCLLHTQGFQVYLASDHGNIEARGIGQPFEGAIADQRGERVRVYSDPRLRAQIKERFQESLEWPPIGLPENYLALIAPPRTAFVGESKTIVGHGGISVEELIVPFVQIEKVSGSTASLESSRGSGGRKQ